MDFSDGVFYSVFLLYFSLFLFFNVSVIVLHNGSSHRKTANGILMALPPIAASGVALAMDHGISGDVTTTVSSNVSAKQLLSLSIWSVS